jgi:hypothetical protein
MNRLLRRSQEAILFWYGAEWCNDRTSRQFSGSSIESAFVTALNRKNQILAHHGGVNIRSKISLHKYLPTNQNIGSSDFQGTALPVERTLLIGSGRGSENFVVQGSNYFECFSEQLIPG